MVHSVNGSSGLDLVGDFSVPDLTKENPQGAVYQRETALGTTAEEDVSIECLPTRGDPHGMCLQAGPASLSWPWDTRFYSEGTVS